MYLWNRLLMASPARFTEAAPLLMDAVGYVNSVSDHTYNLWGTVLGQTGGFGVSALCTDFGALSDEMAARGMGDETFRDKVAAVGACMDGSPEDTLWEIVQSVGDWPDAPAVLGNAMFQAMPGRLPDAIAWAVDLNSYLGEMSGAAGVVCVSGWGRPNSVRLYYGYDSISAWQERSAATQNDAGWLERMQAVVGIGDQGTLETGVFRRLV